MNVMLSWAKEDYDQPWDRIVMGATNATTGLTPRTYQEIWDSLNRNADLQIDFVQGFTTGPASHKLSLGGLASGSRANSGFDGRNLPALNINNPVYGAPKPVIVRGSVLPGEPAPSSSMTYNRQDSIYVQDNVSLFKGRVLAVGGARYNAFNTESTNRLNNVTTPRSDKATVWRLGLVYKPSDAFSIYYNYSESFAFNAVTFIGGPRNGQTLDPSYGKNHEIGIKAETPSRLLFGSIAAYDLRLSNVARVYVLPDGTSGRDQSAEQKSPGIEFDLGSNLETPLGPLELIATYFTGDPEDAVGARPVGVVRNTWSILAAQSFKDGILKGLKVGAGAFHKGDMLYASPAPVANYLASDYTTSTVFFIYQTSRFRLSLNVDNLTDEEFIDGGENATWLITNPGRTFKFSIGYQF